MLLSWVYQARSVSLETILSFPPEYVNERPSSPPCQKPRALAPDCAKRSIVKDVGVAVVIGSVAVGPSLVDLGGGTYSDAVVPQ